MQERQSIIQLRSIYYFYHYYYHYYGTIVLGFFSLNVFFFFFSAHTSMSTTSRLSPSDINIVVDVLAAKLHLYEYAQYEYIIQI